MSDVLDDTGHSWAARCRRALQSAAIGLICGWTWFDGTGAPSRADHVRELQRVAVEQGHSPVAHWGLNPQNYTQWGTHSNRLIPVYTFGTKGGGPGIDLESYTGVHSPYRSADAVRRLYGQVPADTVNPDADYLDQTNIYDLQWEAFRAGRKYIFLVVFDGMDWQTTWAAAIHSRQQVPYRAGRGTGLHFLDYTAGSTTQFGFMVTSPHNEGTTVDVDRQVVQNPGGKIRGGYSRTLGGATPWTPGSDPRYIITQPKDAPVLHAYTDSSSSASSMTAGVKIYNNGVNVDATGAPVTTLAHRVQEAGWAVGVVTSVPISHATPACAYAHNVDRDDYQDLTRDLLGLPSISHPERPLAGVDVLIGGGWGDERTTDNAQGKNFVSGNAYLTEEDLRRVDVRHGGKYVVSQRSSGVAGGPALQAAAVKAAESGQRLLGFYGLAKYKGHLPFATADGDFQPTVGRSKSAETYAPADLQENPTLAEMTTAALRVLARDPQGFWLMVEAGDVDWANHDNNLDNSIGAVRSGDAAVKVITDWVEQHSNWRESVLIVTADHGHYLVLTQPEGLVAPR